MSTILEQLSQILSTIVWWFSSVTAAVPALMSELVVRGDQLSTGLFVTALIVLVLSALSIVAATKNSDSDTIVLLSILGIVGLVTATVIWGVGFSYLSESYAPGYTLLHSIL